MSKPIKGLVATNDYGGRIEIAKRSDGEWFIRFENIGKCQLLMGAWEPIGSYLFSTVKWYPIEHYVNWRLPNETA